MKNTKSIEWKIEDRKIELEVRLEGRCIPGTYMQPPEYPELNIIAGHFLDTKEELTETQFEDLMLKDDELYDYVCDLFEPSIYPEEL